VTTLDELAIKYGEPEFVKIDVEGYEPYVLGGMSFTPAALSFEFHGTLMEELEESLARLNGYRFRISVGMTYAWATRWCDATTAMTHARALAAGDRRFFADIYCVRAASHIENDRKPRWSNGRPVHPHDARPH
jgi:hypothetical protein